MDTIKTIELDTATIRIVIDSDPGDPRDWDNLGTLALYHRRYNLGDPDVPSIEEAQDIETSKDYICLPVYGYDHGGMTIQTSPFSCPWDSGKLGIIYVHKDNVRKEYGWRTITQKRRQHIERILMGEVDIYDKYLTSDVYGYAIERNDGTKDSCWGFYGMELCEQEARASV